MLVGPPNRGHRIGPTRLRIRRRTSRKDSAGRAVGCFTEGFRRTASHGRASMNNETFAPLLEIRNLRCCAGLPARATHASHPDVYASAPHCTVGAHEKN